MHYKILALLIVTLIFAGCSTQQKRSGAHDEARNEHWYQQRWCEQKNGEMEVRLKDKTRCDCLTDDYAIEVDFSHKWAEAIGQSLHYARMTGQQAGIVLIVEGKKDMKHLKRLEQVIDFYALPIRVWTTNQQELKHSGNRLSLI